MADFMSATSGRDVVINFSTTPDWMWVTPDGGAAVPADPNQVDWNYNEGNARK